MSPGLKSERRVAYYICGKCKGQIRYVVADGKPDHCTHCNYHYGSRDVNDIPAEVKIDLNNP